MIHLCEKKPNAGSRFVDVLIGVGLNIFLFERADKFFRIPVLPREASKG